MTQHPHDALGGYADGRPAMQVAGECFRRGESVYRMHEVTGLSLQTIWRLVLGEAPRVWDSTALAAEKLWTLLPESVKA